MHATARVHLLKCRKHILLSAGGNNKRHGNDIQGTANGV